MTTDLAGLERKIGALGDTLEGAPFKRAMGKAGKAGKDEALSVAQDAAGGDRQIVMGGRRRVYLGAGYDVESSSVAINLRPPGAWVLFEKGAGEHQIPSARKRRAKILTLVDGSYATTVVHPGRSGVGAIRRAARKIEDKAPPAFARALFEEMARAWH